MNLLRQDPAIQVWAEGEARNKLIDQGISACSRTELKPGCPTAIWTSPPSSNIFLTTTEKIKPGKLYFFCIASEVDQLDYFITRLTGMVKYSLAHHDGRVRTEQLAAVMGHTDAAVEKGLRWLEAGGFISPSETNPGEYLLTKGGPGDPGSASTEQKVS